jgi:hypothetical protein
MDNVDRLDLESQLAAFRLSLWFLDQSKTFIILQMRDETYERFKDKPPLDTYRSGVVFHITPPRFLDVVKRRLELSLEFLSRNTPEKLEYSLSSGIRITYPNSMLGQFLKSIYLELFDRKHNVRGSCRGSPAATCAAPSICSSASSIPATSKRRRSHRPPKVRAASPSRNIGCCAS